MKTLAITASKTVLSLLAGSLFMGLVASGSQLLACAVTISAISTIIFYK